MKSRWDHDTNPDTEYPDWTHQHWKGFYDVWSIVKVDDGDIGVSVMACLSQKRAGQQWEVRLRGGRGGAKTWRAEPVAASFVSLDEAKAYAETVVKLEAAHEVGD